MLAILIYFALLSMTSAWLSVLNPSVMARNVNPNNCWGYKASSIHVGMKGISMGAPSMRSDTTPCEGLSSTPTRTKPRRKVDKETEKKDKVKPEKGFVVKETRSIADEIEEYFKEDNYLVILYNDPFNKRAYVSRVLQDVFKWDDMQADAVMLQAHTYGYAVAVETSKEKAEKYVKQLLEKGLIAEARKSGDTEPAQE